jgi:hypothetical protein
MPPIRELLQLYRILLNEYTVRINIISLCYCIKSIYLDGRINKEEHDFLLENFTLKSKGVFDEERTGDKNYERDKRKTFLEAIINSYEVH